MTYQESIDWLYSTQLFGVKLGLENPRRLLREYLAVPPRRTRVIHVAGTNGKGSVCAFIESVARATGQRTGLFTSPHLLDFRERIRVSGADISEENTVRHLTALRKLVAQWDPHPTFFELTLAVALKQFSEQSCELLVLETGLGGRLDATSAIDADVTVLTPIALDHQEWLGDTLAAIAAEKAAIIRPTKPIFSALQAPEAQAIIAQTANERRAPLEIIADPLRGYSLGLLGSHQQHNAALALAALHGSGIQLNYETVKHGLQTTRHPGRFEIITTTTAPLILDIAHNPAAAAALATTWRSQFGTQQARLLFGAVKAKDLPGILHHLLPLAAEIHLVPVNSPRAIPPTKIQSLLPPNAPPCTIHPSLSSALPPTPPPTSSPPPLPTLITGSTFLVGEAKALLAHHPHHPSAQ